MNSWKIIKLGKVPKITNPIMIEGLPGIGNVGKVSVDFLVDETNAKKIFELTSYSMPSSVFVNENNLVDLPAISVYFKKAASGKDILFVGGDAQPIDEVASYEFSEALLDLLKSFKGSDVVTLGGIGLPSIPKKPKVYCTGTSKAFVESYMKGTPIQPRLYGVVGPIMGVSGLLIGLAKRKNMNGVSLLAETFGHPMFLGIRGAREIVSILNKKLSLGINLRQLDREIDELESQAEKNASMLALQNAARGMKGGKDVTYIG